ncbi:MULTISPECIES: hypothetical protein [Roseobacteraceae]|jgi:hypothetical protein|uniref:Uncharacterized protein n=1 Tax=Celeribacter baekdonensis B30 TaxID=1208323 RepID=K2JDY3_9RHOB|nr:MULTISPECIES: hypothetical protein [Roseobacteraceae]EKE68784.1 hypothetical protein B30_17235 [Celeribacter baekdonensis B30]KAB6718201.1 hypothetical protein C8029_00495 [Roseobacter sp. TSBP12]|tara:strand:- start:26335 stop:26559 length:225 start_codon:yes stop_codon:yes gene_type:complete
MAFEALKAQAYMILNEISAQPEDRHVLQERLRETLSELSALGLPLPDDLVRLEAELEDSSADDFYPTRDETADI